MYKLDRSVFRKHSFEEAERYHHRFDTQEMSIRLAEGYYLSIMAYGYTLSDQPRLDRTYFTKRKHPA